MTKITKDELLKIARMSQVRLLEDEIPALMKQIHEVLTYAERVTEIAQANMAIEPSPKNINVFREDVVIKTDSEPILAQAPEREGNYFVVPVIIENT